MKVTDVFMNAGIKIPNTPIVTDGDFKTTCPTCGKEQTLNQCKVSKRVDVTHYTCKKGCVKDLVIVYKFGSRENLDGHAYRLKDYVVKSSNDLFIVMPGGVAVQFPS